MNTTCLVRMLVVLSVSTPLIAAPATYRIDPEHFSIAFLVEHLGFEKVIGQFAEASGEFVYDETTSKLTSGSVEVKAASVSTHHAPRDGHVRSGDFLDAEKYPVIRFVAKDYRAGEDGNGILKGELTLLGQTHPVELTTRLNKAGKYPFGHGKHTLGISARAKLERSKWGMVYGVAGKMVGDEVELLFEFEALRQ
jgi:polyisoprenoid-binding protein YceI